MRVHNDVDVGGSYGVKRGIKHTVLVGYLSRRLGFPVRLIEDRLENMRGGDAHGPERNFDIEVAFDDAGVIRSMKMRALDNVGAYAGRSPFQLGKPIGAIVGPYRINSVQYRAIAVTSNKTVQEAVRAFGQSPTNFAIERMIEEVANHLGLDRLEVRRRNLIRAEQFPYLIPSGTTYDSGDYHAVIDKVLARADYAGLVAERDRLRARGLLAGIGIAACLEPSGANSTFEPLLNPEEHHHHLHGFLPHQRRPERRRHRDHPYAVGRAGARDAGRHRDRRGAGDRSRPHPRGAARLARRRCRARARSAAAWRSCWAAPPSTPRRSSRRGWSRSRRTTSAFRPSARPMRDGDVFDRGAPQARRTWLDLVHIAHRHFHRLPPGTEPGLAFATSCRCRPAASLPTADGRVQMYPCFAFEFHLILIAIDPDLGKPEIRRYVVGHDCGTVINPKIVRGMTMGGIAHGIGAALYEEFAYNEEGQLMAQSFMDYLLPSSHEVPRGRDRASRDAVAAHRVRPEGLGRIRLSRRAGRDRQRRQRRAAAARHRGEQPADQDRRARRPDRRSA